MKKQGRLWIAIGILILLTPLGLLTGWSAWGEWTSAGLKDLVGYVPEGFQHLEGLWHAALPRYGLPGWKGPLWSSLGYVLSALLGVLAVVALSFLLGKLLSSREER